MKHLESALALLLAFGCGGSAARPCNEASTDSRHAVAAKPVVEQPAEPVRSDDESPPIQVSSAYADREDAPEEEQLARRRQRWKKTLDDLEREPVDASWANEVTAAIERVLAARLTPEQRASLGQVECYTRYCTLEVAGPEISELSQLLRLRVSMDLRQQGFPVGLSLVTNPDPPQGQKHGYYFFGFVRE